MNNISKDEARVKGTIEVLIPSRTDSHEDWEKLHPKTEAIQILNILSNAPTEEHSPESLKNYFSSNSKNLSTIVVEPSETFISKLIRQYFDAEERVVQINAGVNKSDLDIRSLELVNLFISSYRNHAPGTRTRSLLLLRADGVDPSTLEKLVRPLLSTLELEKVDLIITQDTNDQILETIDPFFLRVKPKED